MESQAKRDVLLLHIQRLGSCVRSHKHGGPAFRITEDRLEELGAKVMRVTELISQEMGYDYKCAHGLGGNVWTRG